jgi:predicted nucleotidyltransferase
MVEPKRIAELAEQIAREYRPTRIILFGSYVSGTVTDDSDVD